MNQISSLSVRIVPRMIQPSNMVLKGAFVITRNSKAPGEGALLIAEP